MKEDMCNKRNKIYGGKIKVQGIIFKKKNYSFFFQFLKSHKLYKNACLKLKWILHSSCLGFHK